MKKAKKPVVQKPQTRLVVSDVKTLQIWLRVWGRGVANRSRQVYLYKTFWLVLVILLLVGLYAGYVLYSFLFAAPEQDVSVTSEVALKLETSRLEELKMWGKSRDRDLQKGVTVPRAVFSP